MFVGEATLGKSWLKKLSIKKFSKYVVRPATAFVAGMVSGMTFGALKAKAFNVKGHESIQFFKAGRVTEIAVIAIAAGITLGPAAWAVIGPHLGAIASSASGLLPAFMNFFKGQGQTAQQAQENALALYNGQMPVPPGLAGQFGPYGQQQLVAAAGAQLPMWAPGQIYRPGQPIPDGWSLNFDTGTLVAPSGTHFDMGTGNPIGLGLAANEVAAGTGAPKGSEASLGSMGLIAVGGILVVAIIGLAMSRKET